MEYLEFKTPIKSESSKPRIGGKAFISKQLWPKDENGNFMTLIFSIPSDIAARILKKNLEENTFISIFSTYSQNKQDYFLDKVIYNIDDEEELEIVNNNTKVIFHKKEVAINMSDYEIPAHEINISSGNDKETFWGGKPNFIQDELLFEDLTFFMQFYSGNFPENYKNILCISDAIGYIFISTHLKLDKSAGFYFGQST